MATIASGTKIWGSTQSITADDGTESFKITPYILIDSVSQSGTNVSISYSWYIQGGTQSSPYAISLSTNSGSFTITPGNGTSAAISVSNEYPIKIASATFTVAQGANLSGTTFKNTWTGGGSTAGSGQAWGSKFATPAGFTGSGYTTPVYYTAPSNFSISISSKNTTSATVKATWTEGTGDSSVTISIGGKTGTIASSGGTTTISGLTPNTSYTVSGALTDGTTNLSASTTTLTSIVSPSNWTTATSNTSSITVAATSSNGGSFKYQYRIQKSGTWSSWQDSGTFSSLSSNTNYSVEARCVNTSNTSIVSGSLSGSVWTKPIINSPTLTLKSSSEHNTINISVSAAVASSYDQFAYSINNESWTSWTTSKTHSFSSLSGNTSYSVRVKMKNTSSGFESDTKTASITTWHNPLTNLKINLTDSWFWYLAVNCDYTYTGSITKYEFAIGDDQDWINTGTVNAHSRGSTLSTGTDKLNYNTDYNCWVKLTDNHGRTYGYQNTTYTFTNAKLPFKTLDERPLYVDGELKEVKVIKSDNSIVYITPNLLTIVKPDGTTINMNKIINNDDRIDY